MFCIKSNVINLESIEMYGLVTLWTSMDDWLYWVILLKYGSHDMRHTGFRKLTVVNGTPGFWGVTVWAQETVFIHICIIVIILDCLGQVSCRCFIWVELPVQRRLCPIF